MALVHILDRKTDEIIGTLNSKKNEYWNAVRHDSLNAENTFDFTADAKIEKAAMLEKRNRLLIQDEDGLFREYIINHAEQFIVGEKDVMADASFVDIAKAKVIDPQILTGTTSQLATELALSGTEWQPGVIEFTGTQTINIDNYTNPLDFIKIISSTFALEIAFRIEVRGNKVIGRFVDMKSQIAGFEGKEITFGKDLMGLKRKEDSSKIITALYGVYEKSDGTKLTVWVEDDEAFQRWGRNGQHLVDWYQPDSNDEEMTVEKLTTLTQAELKKRIDAIVSYECEAVSLEHIFRREHEKIRTGQTVRIKDDGYNPPLYLEARIQDADVDQIDDNKTKGFKIFNFIEYSKADLEKQIATLKQQMIQKAARVVLGNDGETVINLDEGGFSEINVGKVVSPSVPNFNDADITYYVDPAGDDNNDGLTALTPKQTIQKCIDIIPKVNNGAITITCKAPQTNVRQDYDGNVVIKGFTGSGSITIEGVNWYNYINGSIVVSGCTNKITIKNFTINYTGNSGSAMAAASSTSVFCEKIWVYGQNKALSGFFSTSSSNLNLTNCEAYDVTFAINCQYRSECFVNTCKGFGSVRGIVAQYGSWIMVTSTYPGGATSNTYNDSAGTISLNGATVDNGGAVGTPIPSAQTTKQWVSNVSDNWSSSYSSWQGGGAKQGDYGYGQRKGFWWFESSPIALSGKTIKSMRVWVQRASSGGASGKTRIYLHPHTYGTKSATPNNPSLAVESAYNVYVDLSWGEGAWVNIPSSWFAGFQSGSYKGIGVWAGSTSRSYYSIMSGPCYLESTYQ